MSLVYFNRVEAEQEFPEGSWQRVMHAEFMATLGSEIRPFPCIFGVQGLRDDQLRYVFLDPVSVPCLGYALARFVAESRAYGANTSLVVFTRPGPVQTIEYYRKMFWSILDELVKIDSQPWPDNIPRDLNDPMWEFCFAGEPIFVVCNTPAHVARQSRRSSNFMMTFQPRWVFGKILGTPKAAQTAFAKVRQRLSVFDSISLSPDLGHYGDIATREYRQYFLDDQNATSPCPFMRLGENQMEPV